MEQEADELFEWYLIRCGHLEADKNRKFAKEMTIKHLDALIHNNISNNYRNAVQKIEHWIKMKQYIKDL